jgi:hypothetical protein
VRNTASQLRRVIGSVLETAGNGYRLRVDRDQLDALEVDWLLGQADAATDHAEQARLLRQALGLWRGPALEGIDSRSIRIGATNWDNT